jgi:hypothetical protein
MDWALHRRQVRSDIRAERGEYEYLFRHPARVLQDRLARLGGGDRTKDIPIAEWERGHRKEAQARMLLHQARVLGWGKEKGYYYSHTLLSEKIVAHRLDKPCPACHPPVSLALASSVLVLKLRIHRVPFDEIPLTAL